MQKSKTKKNHSLILQGGQGQLSDADNKVIKQESLDITLDDYLKQRNKRKQFGRTRSQTNSASSLMFSFKMGNSSTKSGSNSSKSNEVPMEWESNCNSMSLNPISMLETTSKHVSEPMRVDDDDISFVDSYNTTIDKLDASERLFDEKPIISHSTPLGKKRFESTQESTFYLKFVDRSNTRSDLELEFDGKESLKTVFHQISDVMELKKDFTCFYNGRGNSYHLNEYLF